MAGVPLDFSFSLTDQYPGQARALATDVTSLSKAIDVATGGTQRLEVQLTLLGGEAQKSGDAVGVAEKGFAALAGAAIIGGVLALGSAFSSLGRHVLDVVGGAQELGIGLKFAFGKRESEIRGIADSIAGATSLDDDQANLAFVRLGQAGINGADQLRKIALAAQDNATLLLRGAAGAEDTLGFFETLAVTRKFDAKRLSQIGGNANDFYRDLGKLLGISAKAAETQATAGKVAADNLIAVVLNNLAARQGGTLGTVAAEQRDTIAGALKRLGDAEDNVIKQIAASPAAAAIGGEINRVVDLLLSPEIGGALGDALEGIGNGIVSALKSIDSNTVKTFVQDIIGTVKEFKTFGERLDDIVQGTKAVAYVLGLAGGFVVNFAEELGILGAKIFLFVDSGITALASFGGAIGDGIAKFILDIENLLNNFTILLQEKWRGLRDGALAAGAALWQGFKDGITAGFTAVGDAVSELGSSALAALKKALGIASPSRAAIEIASNVTTTFADATRAAAPDVGSAFRDTFQLPTLALPPAPPLALPSFGGSPNITIELNYYGSGGRADAEEMADVAVTRARQALIDSLAVA